MRNNKDQWSGLGTAARVWVVGAGRFGRMAVLRIRRHFPESIVTLVDRRPIAAEVAGVLPVQADGIAWLHRQLVRDPPVDLVVPAIPVHLAAAWVSTVLQPTHTVAAVPIADAWLARMPNAQRGACGQAYVSHADFRCPDDCPEPADRCTHTGRPRSDDLFRLLGHLDLPDVFPIVLRSRQLLPGVGGLLPADLWRALDCALDHPGRPLMIATACRCHGVVDLVRLRPRAGVAHRIERDA